MQTSAKASKLNKEDLSNDFTILDITIFYFILSLSNASLSPFSQIFLLFLWELIDL